MAESPTNPPQSDPHRHEPEPPTSQEEVLASGMSELLRRMRLAGRMVERMAKQEGPLGDAMREARSQAARAGRREPTPELGHHPPEGGADARPDDAPR
ncbi:MAG: hypothetical protein U0625_11380 [Phycisphaerales bacterium]